MVLTVRTAVRRTTTVADIMVATNTQLNITRTPSFNISSMTNTMLRPSISKTMQYSMPYLTPMRTPMATTIPTILSMITMALASSSEDGKLSRGKSKFDFNINFFFE